MAMASKPARLTIKALSILTCLISAVRGSDFHRDFNITWGGDRAKVLDSGQVLTLSLDRFSGSGFQSKNMYMFGRIDMQLKLVPGNSAGTVTSYFVSRRLRMFLDVSKHGNDIDWGWGKPTRPETDPESLKNTILYLIILLVLDFNNKIDIS